MRKLLSLLPVAALALASCNPTNLGPNSQSVLCRISSEEKTVGGSTVLTLYEYTANALVKKETRKIDGITQYVIEGYTWENSKYVRTRTHTDGKRYKLVSSYSLYDTVMLETSLEAFLLDANGNEITPAAEKIEWDYLGGQISGYRQFINGEKVHEKSNYSRNTGYYTYDEWNLADNTITRMYHKATSYSSQNHSVVTGYELYSNWNGQQGTLVEKVNNYQSTTTSVTYTLTQYSYPNPGDPAVETVTDITDRFEVVTIYF
jgi:hypothetical protein